MNLIPQLVYNLRTQAGESQIHADIRVLTFAFGFLI